jgi:4-hydroxy-tetrahydrodipicolinate synthase
LYQHFRAVAEAASVPVIAYNVPSRTGVDLLPETVVRLARVPGIGGIKEATGDVGRARQIVGDCPSTFELLSGDDATARQLMAVGARGVISVTANVAPRLMHELCAAAGCEDMARVDELDGRLRELHQVLFVESNPIPTKWALAEMGLIGPGIRLPLTPLAARFHEQVRGALQRAGVLH